MAIKAASYYYRVTYRRERTGGAGDTSDSQRMEHQQIASANGQAGPDLVAESRKLIADALRLPTEEVHVVGIRGLTDRSQQWPPLPKESAAVVNQGEGMQRFALKHDLEPIEPTDPPKTVKLPTMEVANSYQKQQFVELAATLGIVLNDGIKYPDLRATVLAGLSSRLSKLAEIAALTTV